MRNGTTGASALGAARASLLWCGRRVWAGVVLAGVLGAAPGRVSGLPPAPGQPLIRQAADDVEWGRLKEARNLLATAVAQPDNASDAPLIAFYSHVLMKFGDYQAGLDLARRATTMDQDCASCHLYLFEALAQRSKMQSSMRALLGLPKLKKELETAYKLDPQLGDIQWGWVELELALPKAAGGSIADAISHAEQLRAIDPVDGRLALAEIDEAGGEHAQALGEYRAAAQDHPDDPRGVFALGQALFQDGDHAGAETYLERALELNARSALYSAYAAANLVYLHKLEAARGVLAAGQKVHPESRLGDYLTAQALKETGQDFGWARQLLTDYLAVASEPGQPTAEQAQALAAEIGKE